MWHVLYGPTIHVRPNKFPICRVIIFFIYHAIISIYCAINEIYRPPPQKKKKKMWHVLNGPPYGAGKLMLCQKIKLAWNVKDVPEC